MTDAEKTEWIIRAAKAVGCSVKRITRQAFLVFPDAYEKRCWYMPPDIPDGQWEDCAWETCVLHDLLPNPFESAEDCEALLVATRSRLSVLQEITIGWEICLETPDCKQIFHSDNPNPTEAYRESIVQLCVQAFEAMEKEGEA